MTRYSASRGIIYSAPPGPDGAKTGSDEPTETADEPPDEESGVMDGDAEPAVGDATADD